MKYDEFKEMLEQEIKRYLPSEYKDAEIRFIDMKKLGKSYEGMTVRIEGQDAVPAVDVGKLYNEYQEAPNKRWVLQNVAEMLSSQKGQLFDTGAYTDYSQMKDRLFIRLSNAEKNEELLQNVPNTRVEDLAVTYHVKVDGPSDESLYSFMITNSLFAEYGVTLEQLHHDALESSRKILPPTLRSMRSIFMDSGILPENNGGPAMYVLSNEAGINGASALMYENAMDIASEILHGDLAILPSSIHEIILLKDDGNLDYERLQDMVREVNRNIVSPDEKLSDHVYKYDSMHHQFSMFQGTEQEFSRQMKGLRIDLS